MRLRSLPLIALLVIAAGCGEDDVERPRPAAAGATATATATTAPVSQPKRYRSIPEAVAALERAVGVPVVLPEGLPQGVKLAGAGVTGRRGYIAFMLQPRRPLHIQYGRAGFDGCGPLNPRATRVGTAPAVINASDGSKPPHVTVVWPATVKRPTGRYGLSGQFSEAKLMAFAESMQQRAQAAGAGRHKAGC